MVVLEHGVGVEEKGGGGGGVMSVGRWWWGLEGEERGKEGCGVGGEAFTPRLLIPLLKGFCSIMPDSFRK